MPSGWSDTAWLDDDLGIHMNDDMCDRCKFVSCKSRTGENVVRYIRVLARRFTGHLWNVCTARRCIGSIGTFLRSRLWTNKLYGCVGSETFMSRRVNHTLSSHFFQLLYHAGAVEHWQLVEDLKAL